jgi:hypothetical protein
MLTVSQLTYYVTMLNSREQSDILRQKRQQLAVKPPA